MGGRVGLHGTDGAALDEARALGAEPVSPLRTRRTLARLLRALAADEGGTPSITVLAPAGPMGGTLLDELGWPYHALQASGPGQTTAADTRRLVRAMAEQGVTLLLFGGGDGTARDVAAALAEAKVQSV